MTEENRAAPLYRLIGQMRSPASYRELMAACLRSIYMGDPFAGGRDVIPKIPRQLIEEVTVADKEIAGVRCAVYSPQKMPSKCSVLLYMHGGGFVVGCSEDTDYVTRKLCHSNQMFVVSVNYSLSPECVFPQALNDCERVLNYLLTQVGTEFSSVYLAGDSAGANLAMGLTQRLQDKYSKIKGLILLAPWLDMEVEKYDAYNRLAPTGVVFDAAFIGYARGAYVGFEEWKNPQVSPIHSSLHQIPPSLVIVGTEDPFLDQVLELQRKADSQGCHHIRFEVFSGMPHGFYLFPNLLAEEEECFDRIREFFNVSI
jgi:acetyl esterase